MGRRIFIRHSCKSSAVFRSTKSAPIAIIYNLGAICGGTIARLLSQRWGRRRTIIIAAVLGILLIPVWIFSPTLPLLIAGGFLMQFMVQGAWGVVPVHLNELSPPAWRGTFPGVVYQLGNFFSANAAMLAGEAGGAFRQAEWPAGLRPHDGLRHAGGFCRPHSPRRARAGSSAGSSSRTERDAATRCEICAVSALRDLPHGKRSSDR